MIKNHISMNTTSFRRSSEDTHEDSRAPKPLSREVSGRREAEPRWVEQLRYYIVCDSDRNCFVITVYGVSNTAQFQFKSVRADLLQKLRVNGAIVSPEHVIH
ncbi:hypothetical protein RND71_002671 [Anisodus tanguticus]|uniref:Uncharacterized protein n=1 Tax=Anisodus tanguticus TaxID=243964 RepID=A0AAE1VWN7_9SOLA|nr:hypothetical protein RND71_002671 [Anisodus tanguticus]